MLASLGVGQLAIAQAPRAALHVIDAGGGPESVERARAALARSSAGPGVELDKRPAVAMRDFVEVLYRTPDDRSRAEVARDALAGAFPDQQVKLKAWPESQTPLVVAVGYHRPEEAIRAIWLHLDMLPNACPDEFDYFPDGAMRIFYCHVHAWLSFRELRRWAGGSVFRSGPHRDDLKLDEAYDFGHYDPNFVKWAVDKLIPGRSDSTFRRNSQDIYKRFISERAHTYADVYVKMQSNPKWLAHERDAVVRGIQAHTLEAYFYKYSAFLDDRYFDTPEDQFDSLELDSHGHDCNVVKVAVAFWLRRSIDGTAPLFFDGLKKLIAAYEPSP
jgi:hypothetical protein